MRSLLTLLFGQLTSMDGASAFVGGQVVEVRPDGTVLCQCSAVGATPDQGPSPALDPLDNLLVEAAHAGGQWRVTSLRAESSGNAGNKRRRTDGYDAADAEVEHHFEASDRYGYALALKASANRAYASRDWMQAVHGYSQALALIGDASADRPLRAVLHNNRAAAFIHLRDFNCAHGDAHEALRLEPGNVRALWRRGIAAEFTGAMDQAIADYRQVAQLAGDDSEAADRLRFLEEHGVRMAIDKADETVRRRAKRKASC